MAAPREHPGVAAVRPGAAVETGGMTYGIALSSYLESVGGRIRLCSGLGGWAHAD